MKNNFALLFFLLTSLGFSQNVPLAFNSYRSSQNQHYWKNKPPYPGYWQQDVHYEIKASLDDNTDVIEGSDYKLTYWNNSPHDLQVIYFHLHQNAFTPGSYYHNLNTNNDIKVKFGHYEKDSLGTVIQNLKVNGEQVSSTLDNTILKVQLNRPLKSGDSLEVTMQFKTYFDTGTMRRRMKMYTEFGNKHYDGVRWYPIIAVYDHKYGWETEQDLDKEYYADFGTYDVELTFPHEYILEASGELINKDEALPVELRAKLDLKNFAKKPFNEAPSVIIPKEAGKIRTWKYHGENIHNFAFTADPSYRIGEVEWNSIKIITMAQEQHASRWQESGAFTAAVVKTYSEDIGIYAWPKVVIADAKDGMEYPMLTLDGGTYPQHQSLLAHEVGHMWFYGMVGSNETYRAMLDEGFTQFLTVWSMDKILGEVRQRISPSKYITKHLSGSDTRYENLYYPYLNTVQEAYDEPLNTHSSGFNGAIRHGGNYGLVYYKTGVMLYNLRYVLGDDLFLKAMQHYFNKWKFAHPYPEDFRDAISEYTQVDLTWFFDQWIETTKYIDYSVDKIKELKPNEYEIRFRRKGRMQMPIDFTVTTEDSVRKNYLIPNTWFVKETNATVLPKWYGWDLINPTYTAKIKVEGKIKDVEIDPNHFLADIDLRNNKKGHSGIHTWAFDHRVPNVTSWAKQRNFWRPDIWYNSYDGVQVGGHVEGTYLSKNSYSGYLWYNTRLGQRNIPENVKKDNQVFAFDFTNKNSLNQLWRGLSVNENAYYNVGVGKFSLGFEKIFRKQDARNPKYSKIFFNTKYLVNGENINPYLIYPGQWGRGNVQSRHYVNGTFNLGYLKNYVYKIGSGEFTIAMRTPAIRSDFNYSNISLNSINKFNLKKFEVKTRVFAQMGAGNFPRESALYLAGANPEQLLDNRFTRAKGFFPDQWMGYGHTINHFQQGGGLNLRGYAGYVSPEIDGGNLHNVYYGNSGASFNTEIDFDQYIKIPQKGTRKKSKEVEIKQAPSKNSFKIKFKEITKNLKIDTYFFSDLGVLANKYNGDINVGRFRMDAGLGTAFNFKLFGPLDVKPLVVRFDMPLFLNAPPAGSDYFEFRYVVGINRAF